MLARHRDDAGNLTCAWSIPLFHTPTACTDLLPDGFRGLLLLYGVNRQRVVENTLAASADLSIFGKSPVRLP